MKRKSVKIGILDVISMRFSVLAFKKIIGTASSNEITNNPISPFAICNVEVVILLFCTDC